MSEFYKFTAKSIRGDDVDFSQYQGKVVLIVNTASKCGFTSQYQGLEELYQKYKDEHFVVLGFPCNQFGSQEPDDEQTIASTCLVNYGVTFPMFSKIEVNGDNAHPLFKWLTSNLSGILNDAIKWNFTKFLIGKNGQPIDRFAPITKPSELEKDILKALK